MKKSILYFILLMIMISCKEKSTKFVTDSNKTPSVYKDRIITSKKTQENTFSTSVDPRKTGKKRIECEDQGGDMEIGFTTECRWYNYELEEAYLAFKEKNKNNDDGKFLENQMPKSNYRATFKEYPVSIDYHYSEKNTLKTELLFPGGVTYITFKKANNDVITTVVASPD